MIATTKRRFGKFPVGTQFHLEPIAPADARPGDIVLCQPVGRPEAGGLLGVVQDDGNPETFSDIEAHSGNITARAVSVHVPLV